MQVRSKYGLPLAVWTTVAALVAAGCSNGSVTNGGSTISSSLAKTSTPMLVTDAPADQVLSLSMTVESIVLTDSAGKTMTVLSTPVPIEASHLDAVQEPLLPPLNIPQDTYVSATITVASPVVVYIDSTTGKPVTADATLANASDTVTFSSPIVVSATSAPICFDVLVAQSVAITGTGSSAVVTVTPTFNITQVPLAATPTNGNNGKVSGIVGQVVSVSGTTLTIDQPNGQQLALTTNSATQLQGFTALSSLTAGELVNVDVAQQASGTLLAVRISLISATAKSLFIGPVTAETGSPVTSFTQLVRQPLGPQAPSTTTGSSYTVDVTGSTTFGLAPQMGTLPALPFTPAFTAATLFAGQNVAVAATSVTGTTVTAESVTLAPQTVDGTIAAVTTSGGLTVYTVTLPSQSALGTLTGVSTVTVYVGTMTQAMNATPPAVGSTVRFNGLLFKNGSSLAMVAGASCDPPPAAPPQHP